MEVLDTAAGGAVLTVVLGVVLGVLLLWVALVVVVATRGPRGLALADALRLLPDVVRLVGRLARDGTLPRGVRWRLGLLLAYLALPVDLVPDFLPVVGLADDAIIVVLVLRSAVRRAGPDALRRHWPGTPEALAALLSVLGVRTAQGGEEEPGLGRDG